VSGLPTAAAPGGDPLGERPAVEALRAVRGNLRERRGEIGLGESGGEAIGVKEGPERAADGLGRAGLEQRGRRALGHASLAGRDLESVAHVSDGALEQRRPLDDRPQLIAAVAVGLPPAGDGARRRQRGGAPRVGMVAPAPDSSRAWRRPPRARPALSASRRRRRPSWISQKIVAAEAVHVGVDDGDGGGGRDGGVERIAAAAEDLETGVGGEGVRRGDETVTCPRLGSTVRVAHAPIITYERARLERRNQSAGARR